LDGLNWYDLFRQVVPDSGLLKQSAKPEDRIRSVEVGGEIKTYKAGYTFQEYAPWIAKHIPKHLLESSSHPLLGDYLADYANRQDVRRALNIPDHVQPWSMCNDIISKKYSYQYEGSFWIYKIMKQYGYKMLFYSGDTDGAVPTFGTRRWIEMLNWKVKTNWYPWFTDGQVSGYFISYDGLDFATIHGVGHLAPQWKRKDVTKLFSNWIHNEPVK
jgi:serine carboxypeptidase-like clade 2